MDYWFNDFIYFIEILNIIYFCFLLDYFFIFIDFLCVEIFFIVIINY